MFVIKCKDCRRQRTVAGELPPGAPALAVAIFTFLDYLDLTFAGWSRGDDGRWRCSRCTGRRRMVRAVPAATPKNDNTDGDDPKPN